MTEYFTRYGTPAKHPVKLDSKGRAFFVQPKVCNRCGGAGRADKWAHTGYTCFDCNGRGELGTETVKVYTAEKLAKLDAAKAKADAKRAAKAKAKADKEAAESAARADAFRAQYAELIALSAPHMENEFIGSVMGRALEKNLITEKQAEAVAASVARITERARIAAASQHIGVVGKRLEIAVTVERIASYMRPSFRGFGMDTVWIVTMRDADANAIVSKGSFYAEKGNAFTIRATVKEHSEYNGERQTVVNRVAIREEKTAKPEADQGPMPGKDSAMKAHPAFSYTRADEVAECWDGVPSELYGKLWNVIVPLQKAIPNIEDNGPHDVVGFENLASHWDLLEPEEQELLNKLAEARDAEFAAWRAKSEA